MEMSVQLLNGLLTTRPGLDKYVIIRFLHELGIAGVTTHDLNAFIYQHQDVFEWRLGDGSSRLWFVKGGTSSVPSAPATPERRATVSEFHQLSSPYPWQLRALDAWKKAGYVGVVEAVTGAGKTRVALQAIADAVQAGYFACVIVPTIELMRQWHKEIDKQLIDGLGLPIRLAHLGGGESGSLDGR
ncbi:MAG: DEAD/DEAH box helicase family protein [Coprothermobacterota bacterium]|nr:DEAD/DEAH box helicase family protein [Coprothermobacterota bacterium]